MSHRPIRIEVVETNSYAFTLEDDDIREIRAVREFTHEAVREFAIDLFENGHVDISPDGYEVSIDFDFDNPDAASDLPGDAHRGMLTTNEGIELAEEAPEHGGYTYDRGTEAAELWCWEDGPRTGETDVDLGIGSTCLLPDGHLGHHEWTPDDQITLTFRARGRHRSVRPRG